MNSSGRPRIEGGIVKPSAFAVLRLITSSYLVGRSTGKSPGRAPYDLSLHVAARDNDSELETEHGRDEIGKKITFPVGEAVLRRSGAHI